MGQRQSNMAKKIKVALLAGGISNEREISLKTGKQIYRALDKNKYEIFRYDLKTDLKKFLRDGLGKKFNLVFPALHGTGGEDGRLQGLLDIIGIPYVFSDCLASALAMDKHKTKIIAAAAGLKTAPELIISQAEKYNREKMIRKMGLPLVIKPVASGSSVGMSIVKDKKDLPRALVKAFSYDTDVMVEKFIAGRELTVAVIGRGKEIKALPVIEIIPQVSDWFDYRAKYEVGGSQEICPAQIPAGTQSKIQNLSLNIFKAVGCRDVARADFIWSAVDNELYFIEINTIPGMTAISLVPQAAQAAGMKFSKFLDKLIDRALKN